MASLGFNLWIFWNICFMTMKIGQMTADCRDSYHLGCFKYAIVSSLLTVLFLMIIV